jgi:hypothetical protein
MSASYNLELVAGAARGMRGVLAVVHVPQEVNSYEY